MSRCSAFSCSSSKHKRRWVDNRGNKTEKAAKVAQRNPCETENIYLPKYEFCNKSFRKDEPLTS